MQGHLFTKQINQKNASHFLLYVPRQSKLSRLIGYIFMGQFLLEGIHIHQLWANFPLIFPRISMGKSIWPLFFSLKTPTDDSYDKHTFPTP